MAMLPSGLLYVIVTVTLPWAGAMLPATLMPSPRDTDVGEIEMDIELEDLLTENETGEPLAPSWSESPAQLALTLQIPVSSGV